MVRFNIRVRKTNIQDAATIVRRFCHNFCGCFLDGKGQQLELANHPHLYSMPMNNFPLLFAKT
jgi:hypothetical protein